MLSDETENPVRELQNNGLDINIQNQKKFVKHCNSSS